MNAIPVYLVRVVGEHRFFFILDTADQTQRIRLGEVLMRLVFSDLPFTVTDEHAVIDEIYQGRTAT